MLSVPSAAATVAPEDQPPHSDQRPPKRPARRKLWFFAALAAIAGVAGATSLRSRDHVTSDVRSGSPGYRQTPAGHDVHWAKKSVTVYLDASLDHLGPHAREAVMQAFGQWAASDQRLPDLSFDSGNTSTEPKQDGKSSVSYGRITTPGHEHDVAITITYSNDQTGEILEADTILNALYPMGELTARSIDASQRGQARRSDDPGASKSMHSDESSDCQNRYDTQNVATHEAGHFFGLGEDMSEMGATMFVSVDQCETHKRELMTSDVTAVSTLYAANIDPEETKAGTRACSFGRAPPAGAGVGAVSGLIFGLALLGRRRSR